MVDSNAMAFDKRPHGGTRTPGNTQAEAVNQPGQYEDSMPASDASADQISIDLSDAADSSRGGPMDGPPMMEPANNHFVSPGQEESKDVSVNSAQVEEGEADCNLSEANYRTAQSNNRQGM